jgi:CubicO group peptidase (beta-lactamase class C family)
MNDRKSHSHMVGLVGLIVTCLAVTGCSTRSSGERGTAWSTTSTTAINDSDELLQNDISGKGPGCSAAVAVHGKVVWAASLGLADVPAARPITTPTEKRGQGR